MDEIDSAPYEVLSLLASGCTYEMEGFPETARLERTIRDYSLSFIELQTTKADFDERRNTPTEAIDRTDANVLEPPRFLGSRLRTFKLGRINHYFMPKVLLG
jgi:hypothetical protein